MKKSRARILILMAVIVVSACCAGCTSPTPSAPALPATPATSAAPTQTLSTIEPADMTIQPSDVPANFTLSQTYRRNASDMRDWSRDHGWKKGYETEYTKDGTKPQFIAQGISVYTAENISLIVPDTVSSFKNGAALYNFTFEELSSPGIGDFSAALKFSDPADPVPMYLIAFTRFDVYEELSTNGTAADYAMLKQLAEKAAAKIH